jgi:hypothetical protein
MVGKKEEIEIRQKSYKEKKKSKKENEKRKLIKQIINKPALGGFNWQISKIKKKSSSPKIL